MGSNSKSDYFKFYLLLMVIYIGLSIFSYLKAMDLGLFDEKFVYYFYICRNSLIAIGVLFGCGLIACKSERMIYPGIITLLSIIYVIVGSFLGRGDLVEKTIVVLQSLMTFFGSLGIISMFRTDSRISFFLSRILCVIDILILLFYVLYSLGANIEFLTKNIKIVYGVLGFFCIGILLLPGISEVFVGGHNRPKNDYQQDDYLNKIKDKSIPPATSNVFNSNPKPTTSVPTPAITPVSPATAIPTGSTLSTPTSTPVQNTMETTREVDDEPPKW